MWSWGHVVLRTCGPEDTATTLVHNSLCEVMLALYTADSILTVFNSQYYVLIGLVPSTEANREFERCVLLR